MDDSTRKGNYSQFFLMIAASMVVMYVLSYVNSWEVFGHAWFSETRVFMVLMMGGAMAVIMLTFMLGMYRNRKVNAGIYIGSAIIMAAAIVLVRSQVTVDEVDYMEGMIPHHSIAILTSNRAEIRDPRVRKLADGISTTQVKEIKEMSWLIRDIRENGVANEAQAEERKVPEFSGE